MCWCNSLKYPDFCLDKSCQMLLSPFGYFVKNKCIIIGTCITWGIQISPHLTLSCSIIWEQLAELRGIDFDMPSTCSWMLSSSFWSSCLRCGFSELIIDLFFLHSYIESSPLPAHSCQNKGLLWWTITIWSHTKEVHLKPMKCCVKK